MPPKPKRVRNRCVIFTLNNPQHEPASYQQLLSSYEYTYQLEVGQSGTRNIQAFVRFRQPLELSRAKLIFTGEAPHVEVARRPQEAEKYCRKEESRQEGPWSNIETLITQGKRSDLTQIAEAIKSGATPKDVACSHPEQFIKFSRG